MRATDDSILAKIWDTMQMIGAVQSRVGAEIISDAENLEEKIYLALAGEQKELFSSYISRLEELREMGERDAFIAGVKFATAYLFEAKPE